MYSFYGGRPGNSFIIVTSFSSVEDMIKKFKNGPNYTDVHFDEHVIINTNYKNDPDNGKIFRRGYNYTDSLGGAILIGQIVGPAGPAPDLTLNHYNEIEESFINRQKESDFNEKVETYTTGDFNITNKDLIPGCIKNENNEITSYNDNIQWNSYTFRDVNDETCKINIGFKIPYLVMDWLAESISAYEAPSIIETEESHDHPFYKKWTLNIPKGIKGDSISNLRIEEDQIFYDEISYDENIDGDLKETKILGPYNMIDSIVYDEEESKLKIETTKNETLQFPIKQIQEINLNSMNGKLSVSYLNGESQDFSLQWVKDVELVGNNLNFTIVKEIENQNDNSTIKSFPINWITGAEIIENDNGEKYLFLKWADGESTTQLTELKWIDKILIDNAGEVRVRYNNNEEESLNPNNKIKYIKKISIQNGNLKIEYNTSEPEEGTEFSIQDIVNNIIFDKTFNNLRWSGLGEVQAEGENEEKQYYLNFTIPINIITGQSSVSFTDTENLSLNLIALFRNDIGQPIQLNFDIANSSQSNENDDSNFKKIRIDKNLTGLNLKIPMSTAINLSSSGIIFSGGEIAEVLISGLDLTFTP